MTSRTQRNQKIALLNEQSLLIYRFPTKDKPINIRPIALERQVG